MAFKGFIETFDRYPDDQFGPGGISSVWINVTTASGINSGIRGHGKSWKVGANNQATRRNFAQSKQIAIFVTLKVPTGEFNNNVLFSIRDTSGAVIFYIGMTLNGNIWISRTTNQADGIVSDDYALTPDTVENLSITVDLTDNANVAVAFCLRGGTPTTGTISVTNTNDAAMFYIQSIGTGSGGRYWVDVIIAQADTTELIPEVEGFLLAPTADTATKSFAPLTGTDNYAMVDDSTGTDGDTTYNVADTVDATDLFTMAETSGIAEFIWALCQFTCARKEESGTRQIKNVLQLSTDHDSDPFALSQTYNWYESNFDVNPETAAQWTQADIDGVVKSGYAIVL